MEATGDRVDDEDRRDEIADILDSSDEAEVVDVDHKVWEDEPPAPLKLSWAQQKFPGSGSQVLSNLQSLYQEGHTTYPRTSNQQYPDGFGISDRVFAIDQNSPFDAPVSHPWEPTEGSDFDPAHPPIVPTTQIPDLGSLGKWEKKVYIRVVKHFLATLMDPAVKEKYEYTLDVDGVLFTCDTKHMKEMGYFEVYGAYKRVYDDDRVDWDEGDVIDISDWSINEEETSPPDPWGQSSVIGKMETEGLGTSATRSSMVDKVQYRDYVVNDDGLMTTELGDQIAESLSEWAPRMTDSEFTAELQRSLDDVRTGDRDWEAVVEETREWVAEVCIEIKKHEEEIGGIIREGFVREDACPECGGTLYLRDGSGGQFWGCENYHDEDCTFTANQGELRSTLEDD